MNGDAVSGDAASSASLKRGQWGRGNGRWAVTAVLLLAAWLFWHNPLAVPPGLEMDELIEAQIAAQVQAGDYRPFYDAGQGREGLYYFWLAGWQTIFGPHVFTLRLASTTLTLLGLAALYAFWHSLFGRPVALTALLLAVTTFWLLFAARSGLRSTSLPLLLGLAGLAFWRGVQGRTANGHSPWLWLPLAGFLTGLTLYAYTAARVFPLIFLAFTLYLALWRRDGQLWATRRPLFLAALVCLLTLWPLLRYLQTHPAADQFAFMEFNRPLAALQSGDPQPAIQTTLATLGMFFWRGDPLIFDNVPQRPVFAWPVALFFLGGVGWALWQVVGTWRRPSAVDMRGEAAVLALLWLVMGLIPGMLSQPAPNFYRTVLAQGVTFLFPALAMVAVGQKLRIGSRINTVVLLGLVGWQLGGTWSAYFGEWPQVEGISFFWQTGLAETAVYLSSHPSSAETAVCTVLTYEYDPWWRPAYQSWPLLSRAAAPVRFYDCRQALVVPPGETRYFFPETADPLSLIPPALPREWLARATPIADFAATGEHVALFVPDGVGESWAGETAVSLGPEADSLPLTLPVTFGDSLTLRSYLVEPVNSQPGDGWRLVTAWEVERPLPPRLSLFAHLLADPLQPPLAQQDGLGVSSQTLQPGDRFWVLREIPRPTDVTGPFWLALGLYQTDTGARWPLAQGDRVLILLAEEN